jgi:Ser/Thr protein kinase RdoA (MazF antagonist)
LTVLTPALDPIHDVASHFLAQDCSATIREFGTGNINKTFLVTPEGQHPFLLQRLNTHVFRRPELVMGNIGAVARHVAGREAGERRWETPRVMPTRDGQTHRLAEDGSFWRAWQFIGGSRTVETVHDAATAREVGRALGTFHAQLSDLPTDTLEDTLPGFHITPGYLAHYDRVAPKAAPTRDEVWCAAFVEHARDWVPVLEEAREQGKLRLRPIHGDPKVNNILFCQDTGHAIAMVDWDTIKPGLVQYDIGDCLRSSCNPDGEETPRWQEVRFDLALARHVLDGYLTVARGFFDDADWEYVPAAVRLICFELGLRFFTDHLEGDVYFKVTRPGQNLARALVQFRLAQSVDEQFEDLRRTVQALR